MNAYTSEIVKIKHKQQCEQQEKTIIRNSIEPLINWRKHFQKNPLYHQVFADFGTNNDIDNSSLGNKTTDVQKQSPVCNGYYIVSEFNDVLQSG